MSFLARARKADLLVLAREMGVEIDDNPKVPDLVNKIKGDDAFEEDLIKDILSRIVTEREEIDSRKQRENEAESKRQLELEKFKLELSERKDNTVPAIAQVKNNNLLKLMTRYEIEQDISVYLNLFERQIVRAEIPREDWVSYLLTLLPLDMVSLAAREPDPQANDYTHIKNLLLQRFKLTAEQFRQKFFSHRKEPTATWRDYAFEITNYFDQWLAGVEIGTFEELKNLIVADQIKRKLPPEIRDHFLDNLAKIKSVDSFVVLLDDYEQARTNLRKNSFDVKIPGAEARKRNTQDIERNRVYNNNNRGNYGRYSRSSQGRENVQSGSKNGLKCFNCRGPHLSAFCPRKKEGIICRRCNESGHYSDQCTAKNVNRVVDRNMKPPSNKILKIVEICGESIEGLFDTGSDCNLLSYDVYVRINSPKLDFDETQFVGISGSKVTPIGYFYTKLKVEKYEINCKIYVMKNLTGNLILGTDILNKFHINLVDGSFKIISRKSEPENINFTDTFRYCDKSAKVIKPGSDELNVGLCRIAIPEIQGEEVDIPSSCGFVKNQMLYSCGYKISQDNTMDAERYAMVGNSGGDSKFSSSALGKEKSQRFTSSVVQNEFMFMAESIYAVNVNENDVSHVLNRDVRENLMKLIQDYRPNKTKTTNIKLNLFLTDELPIAHRPRRLAFQEQQIVDKQIDEWLGAGVITPSSSSFAAPLVLARKKNGEHRLCVDYRRLNKKIIRDHFPLPLIEEILDKIGDAQVFTTLDLKNGFFHVDVDQNSQKYTSFVTHNGQFEFLKMPFGISVCPSTFTRYINAVFRDLIRDNTLIVYMDDVIIPARSEEEGLKKLKCVLQVARDYGLEFNFNKCQFLKRRIEFLGYVIENGTVSPSADKTLAIKTYPEPKSIKQLQSFLGLTSYFRKFIADYAKIAKPLSDLLRSGNEFKFCTEQKNAFEELKSKLSSSPVLEIFRRGSELELHADASAHGFGAVLLQKSDDNKLNPIYYMSKKTTPTQSKYSSYELEVLAVIEACKKFRNYLLGSKIRIITDCSAFQKTMDKKELTPKVARWALFLQEFDYKLIHRPGMQMKHVDALSRHAILLTTCASDDLITRVAAAQRSDENIQTIRVLITENDNNEYFVRNDVVYKYVNDRELLVIPANMQSELIREIHEKGHFAVSKTEDLIRPNYYIPHLRKQVETVITNCIKCILCNRKHGKGEGLLNPIPKGDVPLETYHVDFIGPMPSTNKNYKHIFTVVDAFTKFVWFYPTKSTTTKDALDKLKIQQNVFGNPSRIIHDRGPAFTSDEFTKYCETEGIEAVPITTGVPRSNGQVEIIHKTLISVLSKLSISEPTHWYKHVADVQRIINSTTTRSTKFSPFELMIGVKLKNKTDLKIKEMLEEEYTNVFVQERDSNRSLAKENILKIQEENRKYYNKKRKKATAYSIGDLVAIQRTQFAGGLKLRVKFFGPYKVTKVKKHDRYEVEKVGNHEGPIHTSSAADFMKPWTSK